MPKSAGQSTDDLETEPLPEMDRRRVRGYNEVELHRTKTHSARLAQTMLSHCVPNTAALGV